MPTVQQMRECAAFFDKQGVFVLEQRHGETVHIPHGWAHAVVNLHPSFKIATEVYHIKDFPAYVRVALAMRGVLSNVSDYLGLKVIIPEYLQHMRCA